MDQLYKVLKSSISAAIGGIIGGVVFLLEFEVLSQVDLPTLVGVCAALGSAIHLTINSLYSKFTGEPSMDEHINNANQVIDVIKTASDKGVIRKEDAENHGNTLIGSLVKKFGNKSGNDNKRIENGKSDNDNKRIESGKSDNDNKRIESGKSDNEES